jgi:pimeloyl-ACP methyl ester carboxylesterase
MADDMIVLLDKLKISTVDVVGWSDGGIIGLDLAMRYPARIGRLVVIGANYDVDGLIYTPSVGGRIPRAPAFYAHNAPDPGHWPAFYRKVIELWSTQPHYSLDDLRKIKSETLVMAGAADVIKPEHTERLADDIPLGHVDIIKGGTHSVVLDKPRAVDADILRFFNGHWP